MKLYWYRGEEPNFGDELNNWLMPKVFPGLLDGDERQLLLAVGSVIFDHHSPAALKIVFGSGYGGYTPLPRIDSNWRFYCVRGPRTAAALNLDRSFVAGDTAILMNQYGRTATAEGRGAAFMPHFQSIRRGNWQEACRLANVRFIDPRKPVDEVISNILRSEVLVTEAMHGAIVADALRVPWVAVQPFDPKHQLKWYDWAEALNLRVKFHRLAPSSAAEAWVARKGKHSYRLSNPSGGLGLAIRAANKALTLAAAASLDRAVKREPTLSSDASLASAVDHLQASAARVRADFGLRNTSQSRDRK